MVLTKLYSLCDELIESHMNWETLTPYTNNIQHAQITQLIQNQRIIIIVWQFVGVWFNASNVPMYKVCGCGQR